MKIVEFMSFSPDWFLTLPGMLITGGVVLLLIALVILLTSNKKNKDEDDKSAESVSVAQPEVAPVANVDPIAPVTMDQAVNTVNLESNVAPAVDNLNSDIAQAPVNQEPIDFTVMSAPQVSQPVQPEQPAMPTFDTPIAPSIEPTVPVAPIAPEPAVVTPTPVVEEPKPVVSVYGGVSPTESVSVPTPVEQPAPVIYGGADPLENTAPIPKVESHTLYNQPEVKVVEPAATTIVTPQSTTVVTPAPTIPDVSLNTNLFGGAPEAAPVVQTPVVDQPSIQTTVTPAVSDATPIVKDEVETLDF